MFKVTRIIVRHAIRALTYGALGAVLVLVTISVIYLNSRADLDVWHLADLDEEFTTRSKVETFADYLELEERLFKQLDELVYAKVESDGSFINRYNRGSLSDPQGWPTNWNRSFELRLDKPGAMVLLLHGMSDSPYSLHHLGERLHKAGAHVLGLRIPGHGTAPSGLVEVTWKDMAAAVRLAMRHLKQLGGDRPIHIVGYSNGAALAVNYALATLEDDSLPRIDSLVVLSPAIGVTSVAALAVWQARLGHLLGLEKLAWNAIQPEYDPFKFVSFAVNAGDQVYRITSEIQAQLDTLGQVGKLGEFPSILAFSSVVDATVSTPALVLNLFERLPADGHELVLFDINRMAEIGPILSSDPMETVHALQDNPDRNFTLSLVTNKHPRTHNVEVRTRRPGEKTEVESDLDLTWSDDLYSLTHVALPFPSNDPLYGGHPDDKETMLHLGDIALRGERGVLRISASDMLRLRWNPFYPYIEKRVLDFLGMNGS